MLALQQQLETSRAFVPEYQDVEEFLRIFMTLPDINGGQLRPTREPGVWSVDVPERLQRELKNAYGQTIERYPRATFQRQLAVQEAEQEFVQRVEFSPTRASIGANCLALYAWQRLQNRLFFTHCLQTYRRCSTPGFIFTYAAALSMDAARQ